MNSVVSCKRCIMDENIPNISFDSEGICTYCKIHNNLEKQYPLDGTEKDRFNQIINEVKERGVGKKYDCVIGVSGGCDSSYALYLLKEIYGLRILAFTFDNTWNTDISVENIQKMVGSLDIDFYSHVCDNQEFNDISLSFLEASVPDADIPNDIAIAKMYFMMMEKFDVLSSFEGHSFRTEGTVPFGWTYMDGKYIESIHKKFGKLPMKTYPNLKMDYWLNNIELRRADRIRLLYYHRYDKDEIKTFLSEKFDWQWYGGHHHENEYTKFVKSYLLPTKFGIDKRIVEFSALVRSGQMSREEALNEISKPIDLGADFLHYVKKRLGILDDFERIMNKPIKSYKDYETYVPYFKENIEKFSIMAQEGLIPQTFFEKISRL